MSTTRAHRTARERARAEITSSITDEARRQLGKVGPQGLSLRAVARELGMVSSALYRYFPSRDDLLTALIIDAYDGLGEAAEAADSTGTSPRRRWIAVCHAVRDWARRNPHEYTLVYGTPVPGYHAPRDTVSPAARVPQVLVTVLADAVRRGAVVPADEPEPTGTLRAQLALVAEILDEEVPAPLLARGLAAWTQLFGMVGFELTGQFANTLEPADPFFAHTIERMADFVGLRADDTGGG
ncbi:TetR/AcrR family transcriptional regulator [Saccharomonospora piscinae]|uniref:TetR/AcrR family transcriptional regulator n=1 Tax=Saccharomonospora piscinae TaxID=687388 RepID=UPI0004669679|nr:TetR/AcrR family transcriptional regulator [Saccharomonospora piscinae]